MCPTPIDEQFDTGDKTAVIRREERDGCCDFVKAAHSSQRHGAHEVLLPVYQATEHCRVNRTRIDGVDADLALFQIDCPSTREGPYGDLGCAVNT